MDNAVFPLINLERHFLRLLRITAVLDSDAEYFNRVSDTLNQLESTNPEAEQVPGSVRVEKALHFSTSYTLPSEKGGDDHEGYLLHITVMEGFYQTKHEGGEDQDVREIAIIFEYVREGRSDRADLAANDAVNSYEQAQLIASTLAQVDGAIESYVQAYLETDASPWFPLPSTIDPSPSGHGVVEISGIRGEWRGATSDLPDFEYQLDRSEDSTRGMFNFVADFTPGPSLPSDILTVTDQIMVLLTPPTERRRGE